MSEDQSVVINNLGACWFLEESECHVQPDVLQVHLPGSACLPHHTEHLLVNKETQFLYNRTDLFMEHKLSPVQLTWLHLVYRKMLYLP